MTKDGLNQHRLTPVYHNNRGRVVDMASLLIAGVRPECSNSFEIAF